MTRHLLPFLLLLPFALHAQLKHDANWVFGYNCGLNFDNGVATPFSAISELHSYCTTYSDEDGLLQFYFSGKEIRDASGAIIPNGDSMKYNINGANAFIAFPNKVVFISSSYKTENQLECPYHMLCVNLAYSIIEKGVNGWEVTKKNIDITTQNPVDGRLAIVKHANGKDWWLLTHEGFNGDEFGRPATNNYYRFLVTKDSIYGPEIQQIGFWHYKRDHFFGETAISPSGNLVAFGITYAGIVELYDFDRCTGLLSNLRTINNPFGGPVHRYHGIEFSPSERFLYASTGRGYEPNSLYQLDLTQPNISNSAQRLWYIQNFDTIRTSTLRLAPNGKIYLSSYVNDTSQSFHNLLGVIHNPDSLGTVSSFAPFDLQLDANCRTFFGLPFIPNYNLESIPVHVADAGTHVFYCVGDTTIKGVKIGGDTVQGVTYEWQPALGIDSLNAPNHIVKPDSSQWYYVTITDTTYNGNFSCFSRLDSVFVEVRNCADTTEVIDTTGIARINNQPAKVFPNPTTGNFTVEIPTTSIGQSFTLINLLGQIVFETKLNQDKTIIQVDLSAGIYLYRITGNSNSQSGKIVVE